MSLQRDGTKITNFALCDFRPMFEHFEAERAKKKALTTAEKKELKKAKDEMEAKYMYCMLDGRKEKVGNFRVEPPGLFRGRGEHPKKGALKVRATTSKLSTSLLTSDAVPRSSRRHYSEYRGRRPCPYSQHAGQMEISST